MTATDPMMPPETLSERMAADAQLWRTAVAESGTGPDDERRTTDAQAQHDDVRALLLALGLGDHARPYSMHEVIQRDVLPAIQAQAPSTPDDGLRDALRAQVRMWRLDAEGMLDGTVSVQARAAAEARIEDAGDLCVLLTEDGTR